jgi:1-acyl-sn-glycerol-3-phosphate acyltransferase
MSMEGLSQPSLDVISRSVGLEGTGEAFRTPLAYRFLERYVPVIMRSLTNIHFRGLENIPHEGPAIFSSNHLSNLDPFIKVMAAQRPIHFLAKDGHFQRQPHRFVMISTGQIETFRETGAKDALARAVDVLDSGGCLGIFPEGTRSRRVEPPYLQEGKTGVARLAARFPQIPVVPIAIIGAREFMPPGSSFPRLSKRVDVVVDNPITFADWSAHTDGGGISNDDVASMVRLPDEERNESMRRLYRGFTDHIIESMRSIGAP